ncbi:hypothetical protein ACH6CV_02915 [Bacillota bacterium Meth-B3]
MRLRFLILILLCLVAGIMFSIFGFTIIVRYQNLTSTPYSAHGFYESLNVFDPDGIPAAQMESDLVALKALLNEQDPSTIVIYDSVDALGLGLYDPQHYYERYALASGRYPGAVGTTAHHEIIALGDSYIDEYQTMHDGLYTVYAKSYSVVGTYDDRHPLYTVGHPYIGDFADTSSISGTYTIIASEATIGTISDFFIERGYEAIADERPQLAFQTLLWLLFDGVSLVISIGFLFVLVNFVMVCRFILHGITGRLKIHLRVGASKCALFRRSVAPMVMAIGGATLPGCLVGAQLVETCYHVPPVSNIGWIMLIWQMELIVLFALYALSFAVTHVRLSEG